MPPPSRRRSTPRPSPRKTTPRTPSKSRRTPQKHPQKSIAGFLRFLSGLMVAMALVASGYLYGVKQEPHASAVPSHKRQLDRRHPKRQNKKKKNSLQKSSKIPQKKFPKKKRTAVDFLRYGQMEDARSDALPDVSWYEPGADNHPKMPPAPASSLVPTRGTRPKLVLIIDDISHPSQIAAIRALPYHITPSIFPPSELSATSNRLADSLRHFMVHLPLESGSAAMNRMQGMLFVRDRTPTVQARVDAIRRLFPHARFINNHTGSVFTAHYKAMKRLYEMLRAKGFVFVDSRTTAKSTIRNIARAYGDPYIARDVFIDNTLKESSILSQLKKAVAIAKKRGFAIAIGHPHRVTMNALRHAGPILKAVQTVYIDTLFRARK